MRKLDGKILKILGMKKFWFVERSYRNSDHQDVIDCYMCNKARKPVDMFGSETEKRVNYTFNVNDISFLVVK